MSDGFHMSRHKREGVTIPTFWVAIALSVLLHIAIMWKWLPQIHFPSLDDTKRDEASGSLVVRLAPPPRPPSPPPSPPPSAPPVLTAPAPTREARPVPRPQPAPPVIALNRPAPNLPAQPPPAPPVPPPVAPPAPARPPSAGDFASFIEARRRARNEPAAPAAPPGMAPAQPLESDRERADRAIANNLAPGKQVFGYDPSKSGGIFEIKRLGFNDAEFVFFGWDKGIRRNTMQMIEVQKGNNSDTRIAVVRKMIAIIRDNTQEDFLWESQRLGRNITLSARQRDNAGLEEFLMREFFPEDPRSR